jgi:hypothetical protein
VAYNHQGQRVGRLHVATWADTATVLAADLLAGNEDTAATPRRCCAERWRTSDHGAGRADPDARRRRLLRRAARPRHPAPRGGARHRAPLWRLLDGIREADWTDAIAIPGAQVAVADYTPNWWPAATRLLIRRVCLDVAAGQVSADPRARRRRTLPPDQRTSCSTSSPASTRSTATRSS